MFRGPSSAFRSPPARNRPRRCSCILFHPRDHHPPHNLLCRHHRFYRKQSDFSNSFSSTRRFPRESHWKLRHPFTQPFRYIQNHTVLSYTTVVDSNHTHTYSVHHVKRRHANVINHFPFKNERTVYRYRNAKDFSAGGKRIYIATPLSTWSMCVWVVWRDFQSDFCTHTSRLVFFF